MFSPYEQTRWVLDHMDIPQVKERWAVGLYSAVLDAVAGEILFKGRVADGPPLFL
jgi:hypothetical protein